MTYFSFMHETFASLASSARGAKQALRLEIEKSEALITLAAERGVELKSEDIEAVRTAHSSIGKSSWTQVVEATFYAAASNIEAAVRYPGSGVVDDIEDAMRLVSHAAQVGKALDPKDVAAVSAAKEGQRTGKWTPDIAADFYPATGRIASAVSPVIAQTAGGEARIGARRAIKVYTRASIVLTIFVSLMSCVMFVVVQASQDISDVIRENDLSALSLHNQLQAHAASIVEAERGKGPDAGMAILALQNSQPALQIKQQLQQFAINNRQLYADVTRIKKLYGIIGQRIPSLYKSGCSEGSNGPGHPELYWPPNAWFGMYGGAKGEKPLYPGAKESIGQFRWPAPASSDWQCDPDATRSALEITLPLLGNKVRDVGDTSPEPSQGGVVEQGFQKIAVYQDIRAMAMYIHDIILAFVGAVTEFLLPILYASLGACAAILRQLSADCSASVFHPEHSKVTNRAHMITAVIVGITIGLFSDLVDSGKKASPLAIAFVAGYASDKFFHYLDRMVDSLFPTRTTAVTDVKGKPGMTGPNEAFNKGS